MSNYRQALERIAAIHREWIDGNWETCKCSSCETFRIAREALAEGEELIYAPPGTGMNAMRLRAAESERDRLREENEALKDAINKFCAGADWSTPAWKAQDYVAPLFALRAKGD